MSDAVLIAGIAGAAAVLVAYLPLRAVRKSVAEAKVALSAEVKAVGVDAKGANHGVNNQATGMPTMIQRVIDSDVQLQATARELREFRAWHTEVMQRMADQMGITLPEPPPPVVTPPIATTTAWTTEE